MTLDMNYIRNEFAAKITANDGDKGSMDAALFHVAKIAFEQGRVAPQQADRLRELEAKILDLPRYSFLSPKADGVRRCGDKSGAWIERYEVIKILEAMKGEMK